MRTTSVVALIAVLTAISGDASAACLDRALFFDADVSAGGAVSLNPQPLPPGEAAGIIVIGGKTPDLVSPGIESGIKVIGGAGGDVSLNPQPLPPRSTFYYQEE